MGMETNPKEMEAEAMARALIKKGYQGRPEGRQLLAVADASVRICVISLFVPGLAGGAPPSYSRGVKLFAGTSGFSYPAWRGSFYPENVSAAAMLRYYGERLSAVEVNSTFYQMPRAERLESWAASVPSDFRFALKVHRKITHSARLVGAEAALSHFWAHARSLGSRLGPILVQTPPALPASSERLERFLDALPEGCRAAFEFRHPSWRSAAILELLAAKNSAWCFADAEVSGAKAANETVPELHCTADWGYLRLRKEEYSDAELVHWAERIRGLSLREVYVFFKHEDEGVAPRLALRLRELFS